MSKTIDLLNNVEAKRLGKYSMTMNKIVDAKVKELDEPVYLENGSSEHSSHFHTEWPTKIILMVIILVLLWINLQFSSTIKEYISERKESIAKLASIESIVKDNSHQMKSVNDNLNAINTKMQDSDKKIASLEEQTQAQNFAISNLDKSKNVLFNQINDLEAKVSKFSSLESNAQASAVSLVESK
jgi:septal ring factor EnvC (AmiA/AmiB activator)